MIDNPWGGELHFVPQTGSTMDEAQIFAARGDPSGSLVWTHEQTAGRGRFSDRRWVARPGDALLTTIFWSIEAFRAPHLAFSLVVALGVLKALEPWVKHGRLAVKWPNDVLFVPDRSDGATSALQGTGLKIAGILTVVRTDEHQRRVHAGIGLNLRRPSQTDFRRPAGALTDFGVDWSPEDALAELLPALHSAMNDPDPRKTLAPYLWKLGEHSRWEQMGTEGSQFVEGIVRGLEPSGALLLETSAGLVTLHSGE